MNILSILKSFAKNWKTTGAGLLLSIALYFAMKSGISTIDSEVIEGLATGGEMTWLQTIQAAIPAILGFLAKDGDKSSKSLGIE